MTLNLSGKPSPFIMMSGFSCQSFTAGVLVIDTYRAADGDNGPLKDEVEALAGFLDGNYPVLEWHVKTALKEHFRHSGYARTPEAFDARDRGSGLRVLFPYFDPANPLPIETMRDVLQRVVAGSIGALIDTAVTHVFKGSPFLAQKQALIDQLAAKARERMVEEFNVVCHPVYTVTGKAIYEIVFYEDEASIMGSVAEHLADPAKSWGLPLLRFFPQMNAPVYRKTDRFMDGIRKTLSSAPDEEKTDRALLTHLCRFFNDTGRMKSMCDWQGFVQALDTTTMRDYRSWGCKAPAEEVSVAPAKKEDVPSFVAGYTAAVRWFK